MSKNHRKAVTLVEILVVAAIAATLLAAITLIWSRTGRSTTRSTAMMNLQLSAEVINHHLRNDVRTLTELKSCTTQKIVFVALKKDGKTQISYEYSPEKKTLCRIENGKSNDLQSSGLVTKLNFAAFPNKDEFARLQLALEFTEAKPSGGPAYKMSQLSEFSSRSLEPDFVSVK